MRSISFVIISFLILLNGCSVFPPKQVKPEAQSIRVTSLNPDQNCTFKGTVFGTQGNWLTGIFTSNLNLFKGARNQMKNQASLVDANYVYIERSRYAGPVFLSGISNSTLAGDAFHCPDS